MSHDRQFLRQFLRLYAVTDRRWLKSRPLTWQIEEILRGGGTMVQLREKDLSPDLFLQEAVEIGDLCHRYQVPLIINDNPEIAQAAHADGVHLGQGDTSIQKARQILGADKIIGISAHTVALAREAEKQGADYIGTGSMFPTSTKDDATPVSIETLREITETVSIPVVAIGGIKQSNIDRLYGTGIAGVAVVSALFATEFPLTAAQDFIRRTASFVQKQERR